MTTSNISHQRSQDRAKVVCVHCHARKVRCDLQDQESGVCSNCKRRGQSCRRHHGIGSREARTRASVASPFPQVQVSINSHRDSLGTAHVLNSSNQTKAKLPEPTGAMPNQPGYVGEDAIMSPCPAIPVAVMPKTGSFPDCIHEEILRVTGATSLPSPSRIQTFIDAYFKHIFYRAPVIDRSDLLDEQPSILLLQVICMIGAQLRYPGEQSPLALSEEYYLKVKTLFFTNHETNNFMVLKALCILCFWFVPPPVVVSLDGAWHWLGVAIRLGYQMGLHRESTCSKISNPGVARRIMWFLFVEDKFQASAFGRPPILESHNFDLAPLSLQDFEVRDTTAELFIEYVKLNEPLEKKVQYQDRKTEMPVELALHILDSYEQWIANLPTTLRLYDDSGHRTYRRDIYELYINYFSCIISLFSLHGHTIHPSLTPTVSLLASSCMASLYEEIDDHDELNFLMPTHNGFLLMACVPQIHREALSQDQDGLCGKELGTLLTALKCLRLKWPPARNIVATVERLRATRDVGRSDPFPSSSHYAAQDRSQQAMSDQVQSRILKRLFPFPKSICPRAGLIDSEYGDEAADSTNLAMPTPGVEGIDMDWIFDEFQQGFGEMPFVG